MIKILLHLENNLNIILYIGVENYQKIRIEDDLLDAPWNMFQLR